MRHQSCLFSKEVKGLGLMICGEDVGHPGRP